MPAIYRRGIKFINKFDILRVSHRDRDLYISHNPNIKYGLYLRRWCYDDNVFKNPRGAIRKSS